MSNQHATGPPSGMHFEVSGRVMVDCQASLCQETSSIGRKKRDFAIYDVLVRQGGSIERWQRYINVNVPERLESGQLLGSIDHDIPRW